MRKRIFKWFLNYSKELGYEVSITKETSSSTEYYCNFDIIPESKPLEIKVPDVMAEIVSPDNVVSFPSSTGTKRRKGNNPINYLHTEELNLHNGKGSAMILQKKMNELINAINSINSRG